MIPYLYNDHNSPIHLDDAQMVVIEGNPPARPRIQYVGGYYETGVVVAVQVIVQGQVWLEVLVNPLDERGHEILYRLSKQEEVMIGGLPIVQPVLVRRELSLLLVRADKHPVTRPRWNEAAVAYQEGQ